MTRKERLILSVLLVVIIIGIGFALYYDKRPIPVSKGYESTSNPPESIVSFPLDLNTASTRDLEAVKGIGPVKAQAIVAYREQQGGFRRVEDLLDVNGIGPVTYESMKEWVFVGNSDLFPSSIPVPNGKVNLNRASADELIRLPGIGPVKAQSIIDYRNQHGLFGSIDQILEVKGIGPATLDSLRNLVSID